MMTRGHPSYLNHACLKILEGHTRSLSQLCTILIMYLLEFLAIQFNETFIYGEVEFDIWLIKEDFKLNIGAR